MGERLLVEDHGVDPVGGHPGVVQAVAHRVGRERGVVLDPREALLLGGRHQLAVPHEGGRGVVVVRADPEDVHVP